MGGQIAAANVEEKTFIKKMKEEWCRFTFVVCCFSLSYRFSTGCCFLILASFSIYCRLSYFIIQSFGFFFPDVVYTLGVGFFYLVWFYLCCRFPLQMHFCHCVIFHFFAVCRFLILFLLSSPLLPYSSLYI